MLQGHENGSEISSLWLRVSVSVILALLQVTLLEETLHSLKAGIWLIQRVTLTPSARSDTSLHVQHMLNKDMDERFNVDKTIPLSGRYVAMLSPEILRG